MALIETILLNIKLIEFSPDFGEHGNKAKHIRDREIIENCDQLIVFWDGKCEGTKYTMKYAEKMKVPIKVIDIKCSPLEGEKTNECW
jgi:hypothetical protein